MTALSPRYESSSDMTLHCSKGSSTARDMLTESGKRDMFCDNAEFLIYHWSGLAETFSAATGDQAASVEDRINIGDNSARTDVGGPFPYAAQMPSKVNGYEPTVTNWAADYAFFMRHSEAEVFPHELIVGEFHWQLDEARFYKYPESHKELGLKARELGAGGFSLAHCCPDLKIGLDLGWGGLLKKVRESRARHAKNGNEKSVTYLDASEQVVLSVIDYVGRHSTKALALAEKESDPAIKECYLKVAEVCKNIAVEAPATYHEAVQWIMLYMIVERINGHGNGYGRLDLLLQPYYEADTKAGILNRELARDLLAEFYVKYGPYVSFGGVTEDGKDATCDMSWIGFEAYDMVGGYNQLGVLWHEDIDPEYYEYCCDVVGRHGCGVPALHYKFIHEVINTLDDPTIKYALDTCGQAPAEAYEMLLPKMDQILFDIKEMDSTKHQEFTGRGNELILSNLNRIASLIEQNNLSTKIWIRTPLIPDHTATIENIEAIAKHLNGVKIERWEICCFNNLCTNKYQQLGLDWALSPYELFTSEESVKYLDIAKQFAPNIDIRMTGLRKRSD